MLLVPALLTAFARAAEAAAAAARPAVVAAAVAAVVFAAALALTLVGDSFSPPRDAVETAEPADNDRAEPPEPDDRAERAVAPGAVDEDDLFRSSGANAAGASAGDGGFDFFSSDADSSSDTNSIWCPSATGEEEALRSVSVAEEDAGECLLLDLDRLRDQKSDRALRALV